jgi:hypothetical protein
MATKRIMRWSAVLMAGLAGGWYFQSNAKERGMITDRVNGTVANGAIEKATFGAG